MAFKLAAMLAIEKLIPHRPPFLFVDELVEVNAERAVCRRVWRADEAFYAGHYPGNPITPGVLLCEAVFQSAAAFLSQSSFAGMNGKTPVLTRIQDARFKRMVKPGDEVEIEVSYKEAVNGFHFLRGIIRKDGKTALTVDFALAMVDEGAEE